MQTPMILGYAMGKKGLDSINETDALRLTHVNIAFGLVEKGLLSMKRLPGLGKQLERIRKMNPDLQFVLSVGGWGAGGFSPMAMTAQGRKAFADSVVKVMDEYRLDGVDIDWEYPCSPLAEIEYAPEDKENFTHLMQALRDAAGERIVSIAAGGGRDFVRDTQMDKVGAICDYVQIMTYDLRSGFCKQAGHHTALRHPADDADHLSVTGAVDMFEAAGVPAGKIVIGAAFYSRIWKGVADVNHGLYQPAQTIGAGGPRYDELVKKYIDKGGFVRYWDEQAQAPFLFDGKTFISYDDPDSIRLKCEYLKEKGLAGIMYWEHSCDGTHTLLETMAKTLGRT